MKDAEPATLVAVSVQKLKLFTLPPWGFLLQPVSETPLFLLELAVVDDTYMLVSQGKRVPGFFFLSSGFAHAGSFCHLSATPPCCLTPPTAPAVFLPPPGLEIDPH